MADFDDESLPNSGVSFADFPEDVQLAILSFLSPSEIQTFCLTCKRFACYTRPESKLWYFLCERRWGPKTRISSWSGNGRISFDLLYKTLDRLDSLMGFWRRCDQYNRKLSDHCPPSLLFFEWGVSFVMASELCHRERYKICKKPFLLMGLSPRGELVNYLHPPVPPPSGSLRNEEIGSQPLESWDDLDLVAVNVSFLEKNHFMIEELGIFRKGPEHVGNSERSSGSSPPDRVTSDIYQYFANRTSPGWERSYRRQRRKERQRQGKRLWESEHYVKIIDKRPTPDRPLQGLWKGLNYNQDLCFYIVSYDDIGGIICRRIEEPKHLSAFSPVFWTANATFLEPPFSSEEIYLHNTRRCRFLSPCKNEARLIKILLINSSYDLVIPNHAGSFEGSPMDGGRIWLYDDGTFAFGLLRDDFVTDLRRVAFDGQLLDVY